MLFGLEFQQTVPDTHLGHLLDISSTKICCFAQDSILNIQFYSDYESDTLFLLKNPCMIGRLPVSQAMRAAFVCNMFL